MKHHVFRKMYQALFGHIVVTPGITIVPVQVGSSFPHTSSSNTMFEDTRAFHKRSHRSQTKNGSNRASTTSPRPHSQNHIRTKEEVIFSNQILLTSKLLRREKVRFERIRTIILAYDYVMLYSNSDYEKKKMQRILIDAYESYCVFLSRNPELFLFSRLVSEKEVPDNIILDSTFVEQSDKHRSSRNKKEKFSRYKKKSRKKKARERDFFSQDWMDYSYSDDSDVVTLADIEEKVEMDDFVIDPCVANATWAIYNKVEKAYQDFVTDPCIEEAAWAIHLGTEHEHAQALAKAYQLLSNYQKVANNALNRDI